MVLCPFLTLNIYFSIVEVKSEGLAEYLVAKKADGYKIVGSVECFGNSNLDQFKFPGRCILVMG